jgi:DNA-binding MarR family transcriptional regulator
VHDGRAQRLVVTDEGRKRIEDARNGRRRLLREQLDQWPAEEIWKARKRG